MKLTCLGTGGEADTCLILKLRNTRVLLDCAADPGSVAAFGRGAEKQQSFLGAAPARLWCPLLHAATLHGVEAVLASSPAALLALPVLVGRAGGFQGKVFATEAALKFAQLWLAEMLAYHSAKEDEEGEGQAGWLQAEALEAMPTEDKERLRRGWVADGPGASGDPVPEELLPLCWQRPFSAKEVEDALSRVEGVSYGQVVRLGGGGLTAKPEPSGECIGGALWLLEDAQTRVGFLACSYSKGHAAVLAQDKLQDLDALILAGKALAPIPQGSVRLLPGELKKEAAAGKQPQAAPEQPPPSPSATTPSLHPQPSGGAVDGDAEAEQQHALEEIVREVVATVTSPRNGCVLMPVHCANGLPLELIEKLNGALQRAGAGSVPIYWVSPSASASLATAAVSMEWLNKVRQSRVYTAEAPFRHETWIRNGRLVSASALSGPPLQGMWREPCIAMVSPFGWQGGPAHHLAIKWGKDPRNIVIFAERSCQGRTPRVLADACGGQEGIRIRHMPIQCGWLPKDAASALCKLSPKHLLLPEWARKAIAGLPATDRQGPLAEESVTGYRLLETAKISLPKLAEPAHMDPELAMQVPMHPVPGVPGVSAARCTAILSLQNGRWQLSLPPGRGNPGGEGSAWGKRRCVLGTPAVQEILEALGRKGFCGVSISRQQASSPPPRKRGADGAPVEGRGLGTQVVISVAEAEGSITIGAGAVHILAPTVGMRDVLLDAVTSKLTVL